MSITHYIEYKDGKSEYLKAVPLNEERKAELKRIDSSEFYVVNLENCLVLITKDIIHHIEVSFDEPECNHLFESYRDLSKENSLIIKCIKCGLHDIN